MAYQRSHKGALSNTIEGGKKSKKKLNKTGKGTSLSGNLEGPYQYFVILKWLRGVWSSGG